MLGCYPGYDKATWGGAAIANNNIVLRALNNATDVHFGLNFSAVLHAPPAKPGHISLSDQDWASTGPRMNDVVNRGGTVAEDVWKRWKANPTSDGVTGFLTYFDDFHRDIPSVARNAYGANANMAGGSSLAGERKYLFSQKSVALLERRADADYHARVKQQYRNDYQLGERWSKTALEWARQHGHIHFHLDGMGDIQQITLKQGHASHNITSRELRYVFRNWNRADKPFCNSVSFYNGYVDNAFSAVQPVKCPWNQAPDLMQF